MDQVDDSSMNKLKEMSKKPLMRHLRILMPDVDLLFRAVEQLSVEHKAIMKLKEKLGKDGEYSMVRSDKEPMDIFEILSIGDIFETIDNALDPDIKEMVESEL